MSTFRSNIVIRDLLARHNRLAHDIGPITAVGPPTPDGDETGEDGDTQMAEDGTHDYAREAYPGADPPLDRHSQQHLMTLQPHLHQHSPSFVDAPPMANPPGELPATQPSIAFDSITDPLLLPSNMAVPGSEPEAFSGSTMTVQPVFPEMNEFDWWAHEDDLNVFLPTQLFDTDYTLSNYESLQAGTTQLDLTSMVQGLGATSRTTAPVIPTKTHAMTSVQNAQPSESWPRSDSPPPNLPDQGSGQHKEPIAGLGRELNPLKDSGGTVPWRIKQNDYDKICKTIMSGTPSLPADFKMPPRHPFCRYIEGYFRGFHDHLPFIHIPTLDTCNLSSELLLALAAVGAMYKFEHDKSRELFFAAKAIVCHKLEHQRRRRYGAPQSGSPAYARSDRAETGSSVAASTPQETIRDSPQTTQVPAKSQASVEMIQACNILMAMSSWGDGSLVPEAFDMSSRLAPLVRDQGISQPDDTSPDCTWAQWVYQEQKRRTLFTSYVIFNLHSIAFNVPPMILNAEVALSLPHPMEMWRASNSAEWSEARRSCQQRQPSFHSCLKALLRGEDLCQEVHLTAFGNFVLIHGLIQVIFFERQGRQCTINPGPSLGEETLKSMEASLRSWQRSWESTVESTLDPLSPKGPLAFNSAALLRIAYVRLNADIGPHRNLQTREPQELAKCVTSDSLLILERSAHTDRAVLQCIHALGILVRAGVAFVARTHTQSWGIVHSMSNIECACILSSWLRAIASHVETDGLAALREDERGLLGIVSGLVAETGLHDDCHQQSDHVRIRKLAAHTVRLWAEAFKGAHVFHLVYAVAEALLMAAEILDSN